MTVKWTINKKFNKSLTTKKHDDLLAEFKSLNYSKSNIGEYGNMIQRYLMETGEDGKGYHFYLEKAHFNNEIRLYRTRGMTEKEIRQIDGDHHFWSPPAKFVSWGRLNKPKEPVLYASLHVNTAINENPDIDEYFILIEYKIKKMFTCVKIGNLFSDSPHVDPPITNVELFHKIDSLLVDLMTYNGSKNQNYYLLTNGIVKKHYEELKKDCLGFYYPSAVIKDAYNAALDTCVEGNNLIIDKVMKCKLNRKEKQVIVLKQIF